MKLTIGIPNGSLVDPKRGGLKELLDKARIYNENLGSNAPQKITNIPWLEAMTGRPQELPAMAADGYIDIFFCGDDWVEEWKLRGKKNEKLLGLNIGKIDMVIAEKEDDNGKSLIKIASEYPYLTRKYASERYNIPEADIPIVKIDELALLKKGIAILDSYGATEAKAYYGLADSVVEVTQSGSTLKNYGLNIAGEIMSSECSLYCSERIKNNEWKIKKADRIKMMLEGALNVQARDLVIFNVKNEGLDNVLCYIRKNRLFGDEETVIKGRATSQITLELPTADKEKPLIDIIGDLKDLGASSIDGVPLDYSIK